MVPLPPPRRPFTTDDDGHDGTWLYGADLDRNLPLMLCDDDLDDTGRDDGSEMFYVNLLCTLGKGAVASIVRMSATVAVGTGTATMELWPSACYD